VKAISGVICNSIFITLWIRMLREFDRMRHLLGWRYHMTSIMDDERGR